MAEVKEFKTESKRLLDLMINSIYTNKEIFIRELVSNASDAIDKYHYLSLKDSKKVPHVDEYAIFIDVNKKKRIISISDNGIGMTYDEVINNLGTIAKSGSSDFLKKLKDDKTSEVEIIGQFGVGFYSAFMVADKIVVETKSPYSKKGYRFTSKGTATYEIEEIDKDNTGTTINVFLRKNKDEEDYDKFLEEWEIKSLIKKYSDYVRYPIKMKTSKTINKKDEEGKDIPDKYETVEAIETLNSMVPIWKKKKSEVSDEELNSFYQQKFNDYQDPMLSLFVNTEGLLTYNALIFIPKKPPYDLYSENYERGLQLYTKGVLIMDKCKELIPDYLRFAKGLVDSSDLSLNISREMLQHDRQLPKIASSIEKKVLAELTRIKNDDFDKYREFFKAYGVNLKYGVYDGFGVNKDKLQDLLIYKTINEEKELSLKDYVDKMKEKQEFIYYVSAKSKDLALAMPQMDLIKKQGYDVLILDENIDEFVMQVLTEYNGKKLKSITAEDLNVLDEVEKENLEKVKNLKKPFIEKLKEILKDQVSDVVISSRLSDSPVCLVSKNGLSLEMEKVLSQMPNGANAKAEKVLEINPNHELFKTMETLYVNNDTCLDEYADLLYQQALLIEGFPLKDPIKFSKTIADLMIKSKK